MPVRHHLALVGATDQWHMKQWQSTHRKLLPGIQGTMATHCTVCALLYRADHQARPGCLPLGLRRLAYQKGPEGTAVSQ